MVCFLKFLAFILALSTSVNFIKVFQVIMHVLERMKLFVGGVITGAIRRKKTSVKYLLNSLFIGFMEPNNFKKCLGSLNNIFCLLRD